ncbi:phosphopantetheine-binding protein [Streptomyces sp. NPDC001393]
MTSTYELITTTLTDTFGIDPAQMSPDSTFEQLELDSLAMVEMAIMVQEQTGAEIGDLTPRSTLAEAAAMLSVPQQSAARPCTDGAPSGAHSVHA